MSDVVGVVFSMIFLTIIVGTFIMIYISTSCPDKKCPIPPPCAVCPKCPTCPACPTCPEGKSCPTCPTCPAGKDCPVCPTCPEGKSCPACPTCPTCPEGKSCPVCPTCPEGKECPPEKTCPTCPTPTPSPTPTPIPTSSTKYTIQILYPYTGKYQSVCENSIPMDGTHYQPLNVFKNDGCTPMIVELVFDNSSHSNWFKIKDTKSGLFLDEWGRQTTGTFTDSRRIAYFTYNNTSQVLSVMSPNGDGTTIGQGNNYGAGSEGVTYWKYNQNGKVKFVPSS